MINFKTISLTIFSAFVLLAGNTFAQGEGGENCEKGPRGARGGGEIANAGIANRQGGGAAGQGIGPQETAQRMMSNFDADGNGSLDMQELSNGLAALQQSMMQMQMQRGQQGQGTQGGNQARGNRGGNQSQGQNSLQRGRGGPGQQASARGSSAVAQRGGSSRRGR